MPTTPSITIDDIRDIKSTRMTVDYSARTGDEDEIKVQFYAKKESDSFFNLFNEFTFNQNVSHFYTMEGFEYNTTYDIQLRLRDSDGNLLDETPIKQETTITPTTESLGAYNVDGTQATLKARILDIGDSTSINANFQYREVGTSDWTNVFGPEITSLEPREPDENENLSGWYDFSVVESSYDSEGNLVPSVPDQSGPNDLWRTTEMFPIEDTYNGYDCLTFDGDRNILTSKDRFILGNSFTVIAVMRVTAGESSNGVWQQRQGGEGPMAQIHSGVNGEGIFRVGISDEFVSTTTDMNSTDMYILTWTVDFNLVKGYVNGSEELNDSVSVLSFPKTSFGVGTANQEGAWGMEGNIFYLTAYDRALNDRERQGVEKYLSNKFNIGITETAEIVATPFTYQATTNLPNDTDKYEYRSYFYDGTQSFISENVYPIPGMGFTQDLISDINFEDNNDTYYYETMTVNEEYDQIKNNVKVFEERQDFIEGEAIEGQIGSAIDQTSIDNYGEREYIEVVSYDIDDENRIQARLQERASRIVQKYKDPIKKITFETKESGLTGGMLVDIKSDSRNIDDTFIIEEVNATLNRQNSFVYQVTASTYKKPGFDKFIKRL